MRRGVFPPVCVDPVTDHILRAAEARNVRPRKHTMLSGREPRAPRIEA
jgi:hypothetical protein